MEKPNYEVQRKPCPYYGFSHINGSLIDTQGNQCAFITDAHAPCKMEAKKEDVEYNKCPGFSASDNKLTLSKISTAARVFPREFRPENNNGWTGIGLDEWIHYIMHQKEMNK